MEGSCCCEQEGRKSRMGEALRDLFDRETGDCVRYGKVKRVPWDASTASTTAFWVVVWTSNAAPRHRRGHDEGCDLSARTDGPLNSTPSIYLQATCLLCPIPHALTTTIHTPLGSDSIMEFVAKYSRAVRERLRPTPPSSASSQAPASPATTASPPPPSTRAAVLAVPRSPNRYVCMVLYLNSR